MDPLTDLERDVLAFEHGRWRFIGAKEQAVRDTFGLSLTRYQQVLASIIDKPAALVHDPMLVGRLRRVRAHHRQQRAG